MPNNFRIREARETDYPAILELVKEAFAEHPHSDQTEHLIVDRLKNKGMLTHSLVAETPTEIVGYVAFSEVSIANQALNWYGLGPVAVLVQQQKTGIGQALINYGLEQLRASGASGCVVMGEPRYYQRFGFKHEPNLLLPDTPPEYFMALLLTGAEVPTGIVAYNPAFYG